MKLLLPNQIWGSPSGLGPSTGRGSGYGGHLRPETGRPVVPLGQELVLHLGVAQGQYYLHF